MHCSTSARSRLTLMSLAACLSAGVIAGCGGSSKPKTTSGLAGETPTQIIKTSAATLRKAESLRIAGALTQVASGKRTRVSFALYSKRAFTASLGTSAGNADMIVDGTRLYLRADRKFWTTTTHSKALSEQVANRWILFPAAEASSLTSGLHDVTPSHLATCMAETHGHLTVAGRTTVGGHAAIVIRSDGNYPGGQPETIAIATTGAPYPLRLTATGKPRPGGRGGECGNTSGSATVGTVLLSGFGKLGDIRLPAHAITLKSIEQHAAQSSTAA